VILELLGSQPIDPNKPVFSPRQAMKERAAVRREARKTPVQPSQQNRRKANPSKPPRREYDTGSYNKAVFYAVRRAKAAEVKVNAWHVNQLRHTRATELRKAYGLEAAQVSLGHARADVTQVYAERDTALAVKVAGEIG
jgi:integrase